MRMTSLVLMLTMFLTPCRSGATTVVVLIAANNMVVSSDSLTTSRRADFSSTGSFEQKKWVVIQKRILVATIQVSDYRDAGVHYNFLTWMEDLQKHLPESVSVDDLASIIEKESSAEFSALHIAESVKNGSFKNPAPNEPCEIFTEFVIAGYQAGQPRLYKVEFDLDWNNKNLVGPRRELLYPGLLGFSNPRIIRFGTQEAILDVQNPRSFAYQKVVSLSPDSITQLGPGQNPPVKSLIDFTRALVQVEEETNPDEVGGKIESVSWSPKGEIEEFTPMP